VAGEVVLINVLEVARCFPAIALAGGTGHRA
jgi:hypothetical protein